MTIRSVLGILVALITALPAVAAETYPAKPVRIIVPFAAGGSTDVFARLLAKNLQVSLGGPFVVDPRPGGGGTMGAAVAARAPADGYTLLMVTSSHAINETLMPRRGYDLMRDFVPVAALNKTALVAVVSPKLEVTSLRELVAMAQRAPGKLNYASTGPGTVLHLAVELLRSRANLEIVHVPYKNGIDARKDLMSGDVQLMFDAVSNAAPAIKEGVLRGLATTGRARAPLLPDLPTVAEAGIADYVVDVVIGFVAPRSVPEQVVQRLNSAIAAANRDPELIAAWSAQGADPLVLSAEAWGKRLEGEIASWAEAIKFANITPE